MPDGADGWVVFWVLPEGRDFVVVQEKPAKAGSTHLGLMSLESTS